MPKLFEEMKRQEIEERLQLAEDSKWKMVYHVQPPFGFLGAPTGFNYINGIYHIFYEWSPDARLNETPDYKYIYHVASKDLVTFKNEGIKIRPGGLYDQDRIYGGSLSKIFNEIVYLYSGVREKEEEHFISLLGGYMNTDGKIHKYPTPIIRDLPKGSQKYFRGPYAFVKDNEIVVLIGTMNEEEFGRITIYRGPSIDRLKYDGLLDTGYKAFGYLWESPEFFDLDMDSVLIFNARGLDKFDNNFWNIYQSGYMLGELNRAGNYYLHDEFYELDRGFDFYRPITTLDENGNRVMLAWMAAEESDYPSKIDGTVNALTIPRLLSVEEDRLIQKPHPNLERYRGEKITAEGYFGEYPAKLTDFYGESYELIVNILENNASSLHIYLRKNERHETLISYDSERQVLTLDRTFSGDEINNVDGTTRSLDLEEALESLRIFVDQSSIEIFINGGRYTMTSRIFPSTAAKGVEFVTEFGDCHIQLIQYSLNTDRSLK